MKGWNKPENPPSGQDVFKSKEEQISDLLSDIQILKERNNPGDKDRIKKLEEEIKRLKNKN